MSNPYCEACGHDHGPLYVCPRYSPERKAAIEASAERTREAMCSPGWVEGQLAKGIPWEAIVIMAAFMGLEVALPDGGVER